MWFGGWLITNYPDTYSFDDFLISCFAILFSMFALGLAFQDIADRKETEMSASRIFYLLDRQSEIDPLSDEGKVIDYSIKPRKSKPKKKKSMEKPKSGKKKKRESALNDVLEENPEDLKGDFEEEGEFEEFVNEKPPSSKKKKKSSKKSSKNVAEEDGDVAEKRPKSKKKKKSKKKQEDFVDEIINDTSEKEIIFVPEDESTEDGSERKD